MIINRLLFQKDNDDWKQHRTFMKYPNNYGQIIKFVYERNDNRVIDPTHT
ncbi:hypothetical protein [Spirosoma sp.]|nr:hypothetical protein [Spirosoma sp.]MCX6218417.1 hypothetical protein [Spirosoma sp.]